MTPDSADGDRHGHGPVVDQMDLHVGAEHAAGHRFVSPARQFNGSGTIEVADLKLDAAANYIERNRLLASRALESGDWFSALPLSSIVVKMDNATVRIAVGLGLVPR